MNRGIANLVTASLGIIMFATASAGVATENSVGAARAVMQSNRLINSNNPYLLQHAHNPVNWYAWGPEAFAQARRENKPIFLSVGYSTCYWCHVAERTIYSDPEIAALMNQWFISIKVDREERPDVDEIYMLATYVLTGRGGWPNNVFLTPDLKPIYAGSYFPPTDEAGRPGFPTVLREIHREWTERQEGVLAGAEKVYLAMREHQERRTISAAASVPEDWLGTARANLRQNFDREEGGFGSLAGGPKFPHSPALELLLTDYRATGNALSRDMLERTLNAMAIGGIHDHLAGGFHRYSTDRQWSVPHFEKMLYDNAQLLRIYGEAHRFTRSPFYHYVAKGVAEYLLREMTGAEGGFYTAQDAEVNGEEGASYRWNRAEIEAAIGPTDAKEFLALYALTPLPAQITQTGLAGDDRGVLRVDRGAGDSVGVAVSDRFLASILRLAPLRAKLLAVRERRPQPARDEKMIVALNGMTIGAFARVGTALNEPRYTAAASRAAEFIWTRALDPRTGNLMHEIYRGKAQVQGFLSDYALFGEGLLSLFEATHEPKWRTRAVMLADALLLRFAKEDRMLSMTAFEGQLPLAPQEFGDDTYPSATSATIALLAHLGTRHGMARYARAASTIATRASAAFGNRPEGWASAIAAMNEPGVAKRLAAPKDTNTPASRSIDSASIVHSSVARRSSAAGEQIVVTIKIEAGYHINANPATFKYLIPTNVAFDRLAPTRIDYPTPSRFKPAFASEAIDVYEGTQKIVVLLPANALKTGHMARGTLTIQACNDEVCLPPAEIALTIGP